jgi:PTH1 family peptidyl-tRNA hydrolase
LIVKFFAFSVLLYFISMVKKLVVGLGNKGDEYEKNRHNVGFMLLDALISRISNSQLTTSNKFQNNKFKYRQKYLSEVIKVNDLMLAKPQTMMNASGDAVVNLVNFYKISPENLWVVHDDLDIALGEYKIQKGKGPRVHNGLVSIYERLGKRDFWHVRIGIDNRTEKNVEGKDYVLQDFSEHEIKIVDRVIDETLKDLIPRLTG